MNPTIAAPVKVDGAALITLRLSHIAAVSIGKENPKLAFPKPIKSSIKTNESITIYTRTHSIFI